MAHCVAVSPTSAEMNVLLWRQHPKSLTTTEITSDRAATLQASLELNSCCSVESSDPTEERKQELHVIVADWLQVQLATRDKKVDVLVTNPPFAASGKFNRLVAKYYDENKTSHACIMLLTCSFYVV